jgi:hypothetical protein
LPSYYEVGVVVNGGVGGEVDMYGIPEAGGGGGINNLQAVGDGGVRLN